MTEVLSAWPAWPVLLPFALAAIALYLTPGVDLAYLLARTASQGRRAGVVSAVGIFAGILVHTAAAVAGLSAILAASQTAFLVVKYAGAAYLLYLAYRLLRSDQGGADAPGRPAAGLSRVFWQAIMVNLLNPKIGLFMLAFLPQFVDPERGAAAAQILLLGLLFNLGGLVWNVSVVLAASAMSRRLSASARSQKLARWFAATVLGGLAVRLAVADRS